MPRPLGSVRLAHRSPRLAGLLTGALLLGAGSLVAPSPGHAADPAPEPAPASSDPSSVSASASTTPWGTILGACFGVLFGGALAVWQIRGMKREG